MTKPRRARVSAADVPVVDVVPHTVEELAEEAAEVEAALVGETLSAQPMLAKGTRVLYTNRLGVGPWHGEIEAVRVALDERGLLHWVHVTKPNGNDFFTCSPMGSGPDAFTLVDD